MTAPSPEMLNPAAGQDHGAISQKIFNDDEFIEEPRILQQQRVRRLYAVSIATAATIAHHAFHTVAPR